MNDLGSGMRRGAAVVVALAALAAGRLPAQGQVPFVVRIRDNVYDPATISVPPGSTVTWVHMGANDHTVTAEDGSFDSGIMHRDDTFSRTFPTDATVRYFCRVHPSTMRGTVVVGAGATPSPTPSPPPRATLRVPSDRPTIQAAVDDAGPGSLILVAPGTYPEAVVVPQSRAGLEIRGEGASPAEVVLDGQSTRATGIAVSGDGVVIRNLTVRNYTQNGISFWGVEGFLAEGVVSAGAGRYGLLASRSRRGAFRDSEAYGSGDAGFSVGGCPDCDVTLERVWAHDNAFGYSGTNAGGVVIRDSTFERNAVGISPNTLPFENDPPGRGTHIWRNVVRDNNNDQVARQGLAATVDVGAGIGIWLAGSWHDVVEDNTVLGHQRYGIVASWLTTPVYGIRVQRNVVSDSGRADLAWDGIGLATCFAANRTPKGGEPSSEPPAIQTLYACELPVTVGVPYPVVDAALLSGRAS